MHARITVNKYSAHKRTYSTDIFVYVQVCMNYICTYIMYVYMHVHIYTTHMRLAKVLGTY